MLPTTSDQSPADGGLDVPLIPHRDLPSEAVAHLVLGEDGPASLEISEPFRVHGGHEFGYRGLMPHPMPLSYRQKGLHLALR